MICDFQQVHGGQQVSWDYFHRLASPSLNCEITLDPSPQPSSRKQGEGVVFWPSIRQIK
ncbi:hypothetical protein SAMN02745166_04234 [Prosthecobacter debontii]|uniref:Uncharacterized protein n=1 Tax=Prosthecobacter debontii TaxID=48467 RepID=A0A1T4YUA3_9BACT|nr:hypothetical protein SAMN02745166_04234 [Prosthecobacter debontii]